MIYNVQITKLNQTRQIDWDNLPETSRDYFIRYGLKKALNDSMAGAENDAEAEALVDKRIAKVLEGTMGTREVGPRDPVAAAAKAIAETKVKNALKAKGKKLSDADIPALVKALLAKDLASEDQPIHTEARRQAEAVADVPAIDLEDLGL